MRVLCVLCCFTSLSFVIGFGPPAQLNAQARRAEQLFVAGNEPRASAGKLRSPKTLLAPVNALGASTGGIREVIPERYRERYAEWKNDFLSTETGRAQWLTYDTKAHFTLTITVSCDNRKGAGTGNFKWADSGELVAATITLGCRADEGYPKPIFYPVMSSLDPRDSSFAVAKNVLAATKLAHEFGHVKQVLSVNGALYRLQNKLTPIYNKILLSNGRNTNDPRLLELARQMGGTPLKIQQEREFCGEENAMLYLRERITGGREQRELFSRITRNVELYASDYADKFDRLTQ